MPVFDQSIRREQRKSAVINMAFSAAFFFLIFGLEPSVLSVGAPDRLALDFLPQSAAIAFFGALVPSLIMRAALAREQLGVEPFGFGRLAGVVAAMVVLGLAAGLVLMLVMQALPWALIGWTAALAMKIGYGGVLGYVVTGIALSYLIKASGKGRAV